LFYVRVCVCMKKNKKLTNKQKNRATCFFSYLTTQTSFVFTHIRTKRHTKNEKKTKAAGFLARPKSNKKRKIKKKKEMKTDHTVATTTTATKDKKERESDGHAHTHTRAHQHQHHQNGTRDEVKKRRARERQTKKRHTREKLGD
jgi:hypothetical protein